MLCRKYFVCKKKLYIYFSYDFRIASLINNFRGFPKGRSPSPYLYGILRGEPLRMTRRNTPFRMTISIHYFV